MLVAAGAAAGDDDRPTAGRLCPRRQVKREVDLVVSPDRRSPGQRSDGRDVLAGMHQIVRRDVASVGDRADGAGHGVELRQVDRRVRKRQRAHSRLLLEHDARDGGTVEHGALPGRPEKKIGPLGNSRLDVIANALHHRCDGLRREHTCGDDLSRRHAERVRGGQSVADPCCVPCRSCRLESFEGRRNLDFLAAQVTDVLRDDDRVLPVLIEQPVDLEVERVRRDVPDGLIDPDALPARRIARTCALEAHDEDRFARDGRWIDVAAEGDRDLRLHAPAVERVDHRDVVAVRRTRAAVGVWIGETHTRVVCWISDSEDV